MEDTDTVQITVHEKQADQDHKISDYHIHHVNHNSEDDHLKDSISVHAYRAEKALKRQTMTKNTKHETDTKVFIITVTVIEIIKSEMITKIGHIDIHRIMPETTNTDHQDHHTTHIIVKRNTIGIMT